MLAFAQGLCDLWWTLDGDDTEKLTQLRAITNPRRRPDLFDIFAAAAVEHLVPTPVPPTHPTNPSE